MPLTDAQKAQVRRHLKYDAIGQLNVSTGGASLGNNVSGYRFFTAYGRLEWKMNNLQPSEEAILIGVPIGGVAMIGPQPSVGDTVSVTISGGGLAVPVTLTTPPFALNGSDGRLTFCQNIAGLLGQSSALVSAGFVAYTPYGTGPYAQIAVPVPEVGIENIQGVPFTLTTSGSGSIFPQVTSQGAFVPPSTTLDGGVTTVYGYVPILNGLEFAYGGASDNLDTAKADVWTARSQELAQRMSLYENWVAMMSNFLGVPINPQRRRSNDSYRHGAIRFA